MNNLNSRFRLSTHCHSRVPFYGIFIFPQWYKVKNKNTWSIRRGNTATISSRNSTQFYHNWVNFTISATYAIICFSGKDNGEKHAWMPYILIPSWNATRERRRTTLTGCLPRSRLRWRLGSRRITGKKKMSPRPPQRLRWIFLWGHFMQPLHRREDITPISFHNAGSIYRAWS